MPKSFVADEKIDHLIDPHVCVAGTYLFLPVKECPIMDLASSRLVWEGFTLGTYALTGATGLLGKALTERGMVQHRFSGDIRNADDVFRWVSGLSEVDVLVHFAAMVPKQIVDTETSKAFDTNVKGTLNLLEALRKRKGLGQKNPWLFYASSSHVYAPSSQALKESDPLNPFTLYGLTKLQGEQWCQAFARDFGLEVCIGRIFSFSSIQQPDFYFLPAMFKKIRAAGVGDTLRIQGVQARRDFLRVSQICDVIEGLAGAKVQGTVNIGTGQAHKLSDLILKIADHLGRNDIQFEFPDGSNEALVADTSKLKELGLSIDCEMDALLAEMSV